MKHPPDQKDPAGVFLSVGYTLNTKKIDINK
jgi:hypothetical protein